MLVPITAVYAALLAVVGLVLQQLVGRERLRVGASLGDAGDPALLTAMRRQANFVEQVPIALVLIVVLELNGASAVWLHVLGATLLVARIVHPFGLDASEPQRLPRLVGAVATFVIVTIAAALALWQVA